MPRAKAIFAKDPLIIEWARALTASGRSDLTVAPYIGDAESFGAFLSNPMTLESPHGKQWPALLRAEASDIMKFVQDLDTRRGYKRSATRRKIASLGSFFGFLQRERRREDNPAAEIDIPGRDKRLTKFSNEKVPAQLLRTGPAWKTKWLNSRDRAIAAVLGSGLRRFEVVSLDLIDVGRNTLRIMIKGRKQRLVPINDATVDAIRSYLGVRPRTSETALFLSRTRTRLSTRHIWEIFRRMHGRSISRSKATPHTMRHSFARHLLEQRAKFCAIEELLGHESLATGQIYTSSGSLSP